MMTTRRADIAERVLCLAGFLEMVVGEPTRLFALASFVATAPASERPGFVLFLWALAVGLSMVRRWLSGRWWWGVPVGTDSVVFHLWRLVVLGTVVVVLNMNEGALGPEWRPALTASRWALGVAAVARLGALVAAWRMPTTSTTSVPAAVTAGPVGVGIPSDGPRR